MTKKPKTKRGRKQRRKAKVDVAAATATKQDEPLELEMQRLQIGSGNEDDLLEEAIKLAAVEKKEIEAFEAKMKCTHGYESDEYIERFYQAFHGAGAARCRIGHAHIGLVELFDETRKVTKSEFADVWSDSTKIASVVQFLASNGIKQFLKGIKTVGLYACIASYFEQFAKVNIDKTQAVFQANKVLELSQGDDHTIVSFYRRRIPCTCLDEKEVKSIKKKGVCWNESCRYSIQSKLANSNSEWLDRSNTMLCERCRYVSNCSVECQQAHRSFHKVECDDAVAKRIAFDEAKCNRAT